MEEIYVIGGNHHNTLGVIRSLGYKGVPGGKVILYEYGVVCTVLILLSCLYGYHTFSRRYGSVSFRKNLCLLLIFIGAFYKGGMIMSYYIMFLLIIYPLIYKTNNKKIIKINENSNLCK